MRAGDQKPNRNTNPSGGLLSSLDWMSTLHHYTQLQAHLSHNWHEVMCTDSDDLWTAGLSLKGLCYEGIVKDVESLLEKFWQQTVTTWGTRTSTTTASKAVVRSID